MASGPGLLYVSAEPHESLTPAQFHDWYNNEHGPVRLRLPFVVNGFRYRRRGDSKPTWLALYEITDVAELAKAPYTTLREPRHKTTREVKTMEQITMDRRIYELLYTTSVREMKSDESGTALLVDSICIPVGHEAEFRQWTIDQHIPSVSKTASWLRSRLFHASPKNSSNTEFLIIHELSSEDLAGLHSLTATGDPKYASFRSMSDSTPEQASWLLQYTLGPAPRELGALWNSSASNFTSLDQKTKTFPVPAVPAIESYVTTEDGVELAYRLEGNGDPDAPLIVLVNSILVDWSVWDRFVAAFVTDARHKQFRILRYNARGRSANAGGLPVSLDLLTRDLRDVLDAVRAHRNVSAVGVSLGGATVLNIALMQPDRFPRFVACDTNDVAPAGNPKAWDERISLAEAEGAKTRDGQAIVGEQLAEKTVRRWFVEASYDGGSQEAEVRRIKEVVRTNSLPGFTAAVKALYRYDLQPKMKEGRATGLFVVGDRDGILPQTMASMAQRYGASGGELAIIEGAGHLPMAEQPVKCAQVVGEFLCRT